MSIIYWPPTRPREDGGIRANWGWSYRDHPTCRAVTEDPEFPEEFEVECCRPAGHTGRHFDWKWSHERCVISLVWGDA